MRQLWLDVSPLLAWRGPPTGIPRVASQITRYLIEAGRCSLQLCHYDPTRQDFFLLQKSEVESLVLRLDQDQRLSNNPDWITAEQTSDRVRFGAGDLFLSFGANWASLDYYRSLYAIKRTVQLRVGVIIYDLIPFTHPEFFWTSFYDPFVTSMVDNLWTADLNLCISLNTERELGKFAQYFGLPAPRTATIRLGELEARTHGPQKALESSVRQPGYVLCVCTFEPRKNHFVLYQAWKYLVRTRSPQSVPHLVLVGGKGWNSEFILHALQQDPEIRPFIQVLHQVNDEQLQDLYKNSLLTVYPSFYEGWGLPVAESLAYGKICIASSGSSLEEIAPNLTLHCDPLQSSQWANMVWEWCQDEAKRAEKVKQIIQSYQPTSWQETASKVSGLLEGL